MTAQYDQIKLMIAERLAASATERLAREAHRSQADRHRRPRQIRARLGGVVAGAGSVLSEQRVGDEGRAPAQRPA